MIKLLLRIGLSLAAIGLPIAACIVMHRLGRKAYRREARDFAAARRPVPPEAFAADCGFASDSFEAQVALAVRDALGRFSGIPSKAIRAEDHFDKELDILEPCFEFPVLDIGFALQDALQESMEIKLSNKELEKIKTPDPDFSFNRGLTVRGWIDRVLVVVEEHMKETQ